MNAGLGHGIGLAVAGAVKSGIGIGNKIQGLKKTVTGLKAKQQKYDNAMKKQLLSKMGLNENDIK